MDMIIEVDRDWIDELRDADRVVYEDRDGRTVVLNEVDDDE